MEFVNELPVWVLALLIFWLRVVDVSMGTLRTLAIVEERTLFSVVLGFWEVLIWLLAVAQVIGRINDSLVLAVAYAAGFAAGNAAGIWLEKRLAHGSVVLRIVSTRAGRRIAEALRKRGQTLTTFTGDGRDGPVTLVYATCTRRRLSALLVEALTIDPGLFYVVERANRWGHGRRAVPHPTGWRAAFKRK